jgi:putative acetyltransferase
MNSVGWPRDGVHEGDSHLGDVSIRHAEPADAEALHRIFVGRGVVHGTLHLPFQTVESTRKWLSDKPDGLYVLVAEVDEEVVGNLDLSTSPCTPRRRHVGDIAMAVRDD